MSITVNEKKSAQEAELRLENVDKLIDFEPPRFHTQLYFCSFVAALGGFINGFDSGAISSIFAMPNFNDRFFPSNRIDHFQGLLLALYLTANAISAFCSGYFCDRFSRKYTMILSSFIFMIGITFQIIGYNFGLILAGRIISGFGNGLMNTAITTYHSEIAPAHIRGRIVGYLALTINFGQLVSFFITFGTSYLSSSWSWRAPWLIHALICLLFILLALTLPFSPRWLIDHDRLDEATRVLSSLLHLPPHHPLVLQQFDTIYQEILFEKSVGHPTYLELFRGTNLKRTVLSCFSSVGCPFTGSISLLYYAPQIFQSAGLGDVSASIATSGGTGILSVLCAYLSLQWCVDRWGRRFVLGSGGLVMAITLFVVGALFQTYSDESRITIINPYARNTIIAMIYIYMGVYQYSWSVASIVYSVEVFNMRTRAKGMALSFGSFWIAVILLTYCTPLAIARSPPAVFFFFAVSCLVCFVGCLFIPETKGLSLEEMEYLFGARKAD